VTVAVAQGLLVFFSLLLLFMWVAGLSILITKLGRGLPIGVLFVFSVIGGMVVLLLVAFRGLVKRRVYGRWLTILSLVLLWTSITVATLEPLADAYEHYISFWQLFETAVLQLLLHAGFLVLILRLAFSKNVNEFFHQQSSLN
jgi:hypothetical protein